MSNPEKGDPGRVDVDIEECKGCGLCVEACPPKVLQLSEELNHHGYHPAQYLGVRCTGCGICFYVCPEPGAITVMQAAWRLRQAPQAKGIGTDVHTAN